MNIRLHRGPGDSNGLAGERNYIEKHENRFADIEKGGNRPARRGRLAPPTPSGNDAMRTLSFLFFLCLSSVSCFPQVFGRGADTATAVFSGKTCPDMDATVTVKIMKRNLDSAGDTWRKLSNDAVHYHAVAFDADGNVVGNFGWTTGGRVFSEPRNRFSTDYEQVPVAEATVAFKDWSLVEHQFRYNESRSGYSLMNNGLYDYHSAKQKNGKEFFNCQFAMNRFWSELKKTESFKETKGFSWPGGNLDILTFANSSEMSEPEMGEFKDAVVSVATDNPVAQGAGTVVDSLTDWVYRKTHDDVVVPTSGNAQKSQASSTGGTATPATATSAQTCEATAQGGTAKRTIDIPSFSDIFGGACGPCVAGDLMGTCTTVGCPNYGRPHREYKWQ